MSKESDIPTLFELTKLVCNKLEVAKIQFAIAGGICADIYRGEPRATDDIDVLVAVDEQNIEQAKEIIKDLGYSPAIVTENMLRGETRFKRKSKQGPPQIIVGRDTNKPYGVDFLLMTFPWANTALERSKSNLIKISGIGEIPCLTVEDMIISKLFAIKNNSTRRYKKSDIPDIALMLENNADIDLVYLSHSMEVLELILPQGVESEAHFSLVRISKKMRRRKKLIDY
ncbi:MAG: nucleotidyl transferase AbiEii/AbiGii toxin family protein [Bdellovibrionota bacterium]